MADHVDRIRAAVKDRYAIERQLGQGGMATVYLANDLKHQRKVALKVLRPELAAALGAERFLQEIRVTANLHHPHIVQLYDSGEADGLLYYVMPWVEGESLREKLNREKQLSIEEAVAITRAVADALDFAHRRQVIHRDIKPENVLLHEGTPMVADFGIALAIDRVGGERLTGTGLSLGTPSYTSPEQATGDRHLDARTDVYAMGSMLYEMLAGDPPFTGSNIQAIIAQIVADRPVPLRVVRDTVPAHIEAAVDKALAKVPADRFAGARAFADALAAAAADTVERPATPASAGWRWRPVLVYGLPAAAATLILAWALRGGSGAPASGNGARGAITALTSFVGWEWSPSWSPDGSMITYSHIVGGSADVATLARGGGDPHILTGESPADEFNPRWSPDGSKIAFLSDRGAGTNIYWISPTGGPEHKVVETGIPFLERMGAWAGALGSNAWSPDGQELVFSKLEEDGDVALWKVNLGTREQTRLSTPPPGGEDLGGAWSFDGRSILFVRGEKGNRTLWRIPADGGDPSLLLEDEPIMSHVAWYPDDSRIVVPSARSGTFNLWELELATGRMQQLTVGAGLDWAPAVARDGSIAYVQFGHQIDLYWARVDAPGEEHERLTSYTGDNFGARVSPDGHRVLYYSPRSGTHDLWVLDRATGLHAQLTDGPANDRLADWSPDGAEVVFMSDRGGAVQLWVVETASGTTRLLTDHELPWASHNAEAQGGPRWAPSGDVIGYLAPTDEGNALWLVGTDGSDAHPTAVRGVLSFGWYRDGRRVVYTRRAPDGSGQVELRAADLATGEDILLRAGAIAEVAVSPDGSALTFIEAVSHFTMEIYLLRLAPAADPGGLPRAVGAPEQITFGEGAWHAHSGGWAPDGSGIVYSRDRDFGDIYVIAPTR